MLGGSYPPLLLIEEEKFHFLVFSSFFPSLLLTFWQNRSNKRQSQSNAWLGHPPFAPPQLPRLQSVAHQERVGEKFDEKRAAARRQKPRPKGSSNSRQPTGIIICPTFHC